MVRTNLLACMVIAGTGPALFSQRVRSNDGLYNATALKTVLADGWLTEESG
jgi:hypothetical protein